MTGTEAMMADEWIKMRVGLLSDVRVTRLARLAGLPSRTGRTSRSTTIGALFSVWSLAHRHAKNDDGDLDENMDEGVIDDETGIDGFAEAMIRMGWLLRTDSGLRIPRFDKHMSYSALKRAEHALRAQQQRAKQDSDSKASRTAAHSERTVAHGSRTKTETEIKTESLKNTSSPDGDGKSAATPKSSPAKTSKDDLRWADRIYEAYPRKVGRKVAIPKIVSAIIDLASGKPDRPPDLGDDHSWPPDDPRQWLLERVQQYACSPAGRAEKFTPHPATWFHQGRYLDDAADWRRTTRSKGDDWRDEEREGQYPEPDFELPRL